MNRIVFFRQMSKSSTSKALSSSNTTKTDTMQPVVFGSFKVALSPDARGRPSVTVPWSTRTVTSAAGTARALMIVRVGVAALERDALDGILGEPGVGT